MEIEKRVFSNGLVRQCCVTTPARSQYLHSVRSHRMECPRCCNMPWIKRVIEQICTFVHAHTKTHACAGTDCMPWTVPARKSQRCRKLIECQLSANATTNSTIRTKSTMNAWHVVAMLNAHAFESILRIAIGRLKPFWRECEFLRQFSRVHYLSVFVWISRCVFPCVFRFPKCGRNLPSEKRLSCVNLIVVKCIETPFRGLRVCASMPTPDTHLAWHI